MFLMTCALDVICHFLWKKRDVFRKRLMNVMTVEPLHSLSDIEDDGSVIMTYPWTVPILLMLHLTRVEKVEHELLGGKQTTVEDNLKDKDVEVN